MTDLEKLELAIRRVIGLNKPTLGYNNPTEAKINSTINLYFVMLADQLTKINEEERKKNEEIATPLNNESYWKAT